jgi:hypothetical protein
MAFQHPDNLNRFISSALARPCHSAHGHTDLPEVKNCRAYSPFYPVSSGRYGLKKLASIFQYKEWQHDFLFKKIRIMSGLLYLIAVILIIGWLLGVFVYSVGGLIHILIVLAIISLILGVIRRA